MDSSYTTNGKQNKRETEDEKQADCREVTESTETANENYYSLCDALSEVEESTEALGTNEKIQTNVFSSHTSNSVLMSDLPGVSGRAVSNPISIPNSKLNQEQVKAFISPSHFPIFISPKELGDDIKQSDGKIVISSSPIKPGLIFNFLDKQQQILFDLAVIHECNLDKQFLLNPKHEPPKNLFHVLSDKMENYYWDKLENQLAQDPPVLDEALKLVGDIKQGLYSILLPWHNRIREEIAEALDEDLIRQQAENGVFDFEKCVAYIISLMAKLCAPVRDEGIAELRKVEGIVNSFKGIFEMLNHMRIDMINYHLISLRSELLRNGRKYERERFQELLKICGSELPLTRKWLAKYGPVSNVREKKGALQKAFLEFLIWDEANASDLPEPLCHDGHRFSELAEEYFSIIFAATVIAVTFGHIKGELALDDVFRNSLKDNLFVLLKGVKSDSHVERVLPNITEQIVKLTRDRQSSCTTPCCMSEEEKNILIAHLCDINSKHPVRQLMKERLDESLINILNSSNGSTILIPTLQYLTEEIHSLGRSFSQLICHSTAVYGDYFYKCFEMSD